MPEIRLFGTDAERARFEQTARDRRLVSARPTTVGTPPAMALVVTATVFASAWR